MSPRVAILGATGAVGREMRRQLSKRNFPLDGDPVLLASPRSAGSTVTFDGRDLTVKAVSKEAFDGIDIALFSAGASRSREWADTAVAAGAIVVDNSSAFRQDDTVPLVVSEVNPEAAANRPRGIIANPNCTTMVLMVAAKPLHDVFGLTSMVTTSFQAAGGAGQSGIDELMAQTVALSSDAERLRSNGRATEAAVQPDAHVFSKPIAMNVLAHCGSFTDARYTDEEWKLVNESRKILGINDLAVAPTCVRVPVVVGHSIAARMTFASAVTRAQVMDALAGAKGLQVVDGIGGDEALAYPTPLGAAGEDDVFVGRIREDLYDPKSINLFVVGDNLLKGAALNTVQIAELLV
ncbi:MAG: aspartate-semialdehyde dehydrogenase [Nitriliruptoraceae bacterium]